MNNDPGQTNPNQSSPRDNLDTVFAAVFERPADARSAHGVRLTQDMVGNRTIKLESSDSQYSDMFVLIILDKDQEAVVELGTDTERRAGQIEHYYEGVAEYPLDDTQLQMVADHLREVFTPPFIDIDTPEAHDQKFQQGTTELIQGFTEKGTRLMQAAQKAGTTIIDLTESGEI